MRKLAILLLCVACYGKTNGRQPPSAVRAPQTPSTVNNSGGSLSSIVINSADGSAVVQIAQQGSDVSVTYDNHTLIGRVRDSGKRKYAENGAVVLEIKPSGDGFKVRTSDGKLLWKIKKSEEKIKISDNEENKNPFELKQKEAKVKIYDGAARLIGEVKTEANGVKVTDAAGNARFRSSATRAEPYFGVAVIDGIPARERAVIIAELALSPSW